MVKVLLFEYSSPSIICVTLKLIPINMLLICKKQPPKCSSLKQKAFVIFHDFSWFLAHLSCSAEQCYVMLYGYLRQNGNSVILILSLFKVFILPLSWIFCIILILWTYTFKCYFLVSEFFGAPLKFAPNASASLASPSSWPCHWGLNSLMSLWSADSSACLGCSWLGWFSPTPCHLISCMCLMSFPSRLDQLSSRANLGMFSWWKMTKKVETC